MIADTIRYKNRYSSDYYYLQLDFPDCHSKFKKEKSAREEKSCRGEWWELVLSGEKLSSVSESEANKTHYEVELEKFEKAKKFFQEKLPELLETHRGKYACSVEGHILIDNDKSELKEKAIKEFGYHSMYISKIDDVNKTTYKVIQPKLVVK